MIKEHPTAQWWMLLMWFFTALGFRIVGFRWISQPLKEPLSALVLVSVLGWLAISLLLNLVDDGERYGMYFLQSMFSIFAFSRVTSRWWHGAERFQMIADWLRVAIKGMILFCRLRLLDRCCRFCHSHQDGDKLLRPEAPPGLPIARTPGHCIGADEAQHPLLEARFGSSHGHADGRVSGLVFGLGQICKGIGSYRHNLFTWRSSRAAASRRTYGAGRGLRDEQT